MRRSRSRSRPRAPESPLYHDNIAVIRPLPPMNSQARLQQFGHRPADPYQADRVIEPQQCQQQQQQQQEPPTQSRSTQREPPPPGSRQTQQLRSAAGEQMNQRNQQRGAPRDPRLENDNNNETPSIRANIRRASQDPRLHDELELTATSKTAMCHQMQQSIIGLLTKFDPVGYGPSTLTQAQSVEEPSITAMETDGPAPSSSMPTKFIQLNNMMEKIQKFMEKLNNIVDNANQPLHSLVQFGEQPEIAKHFVGAPMLNALIQNGRELDNASLMDRNKNDKVLLLLRRNITRLEQICNEWLNTGHYSEVPDRHRLLYAFICAHRAKLEHFCGDNQAALRACDEGLLKGNDLEDGSLARFASFLCTKFLPIPPEIVEQQEKFKSMLFPAPPSLPNYIEIPTLCLPSLDTFFAQFFSPQKPLVIRGMVNEWPAFAKWSYDYNQTAEDLLNNIVADQLTQLEIEENRSIVIGGTNENGPSYSAIVASYIVHSHCPRVISELKQQREDGASSPPTNLMPENFYQRAEEIDEMTNYLARIEEERKFCVAKANSIVSRNYAIRAHYANKARSIVEEKRYLESQCDRIRAWNAHNDVYVDLHDMGTERALELIKYKIDLCREKHPNYRKLHAITGYGKTTGQPSIIRARLIQFLKQRGIEYAISPTNCGVLHIRLTGIHQRLTDE